VCGNTTEDSIVTGFGMPLLASG